MANPDLVASVKDADILLHIVPHQFVPGICARIKDHIKPDSINCSLIKVPCSLSPELPCLFRGPCRIAPVALSMPDSLSHYFQYRILATNECKDKYFDFTFRLER